MDDWIILLIELPAVLPGCTHGESVDVVNLSVFPCPPKSVFCFSHLQANLQGVHWPAHSGSIASGKLSAGSHHGAGNPRLPDPLQPHHSRLRLSGHLRRHDLTAELPERGAQTSGQDVPELRQRHPGILRQWKQIYRQNGQAQEMRAQRRIPTNLRTPPPPTPLRAP